MPIENFEEVKQYIQDNLDKDENIKNYVSGFVTQDRVSNFLSTDDGKRFLQPTLDQYHSKSLKSYLDNNLDKLYKERYAKEHPNADPKDQAIAEMKAELERFKADGLRKERVNSALKFAQEKNLPTDLVDFFIGNDDESTTANLEKFMTIIAARDEAIKLEFAKGNSYTPPNGDKTNLSGEEKLRAEMAKYMK